MEGRNHDNTIFYQEKVHHRQQLRNQIHPQTIEKLEINTNPSHVSRKAYLSLYQDELEREIKQHNINKHWEKAVQNVLYVPLNKDNSNSSVFREHSKSNLSLGKIFQDFEKEKALKVQIHINNNYDGGKGFFKASEQWNKLQEKRAQQLRETLHKQIENKKWSQLSRKNAKNIENQTFQKKQQFNRSLSIQQKSMDKQVKENNRNFILKQIEQQAARKQRHSMFQYKNQARHNPITNPIEYHIDNPYILKKIQDKMVSKMC